MRKLLCLAARLGSPLGVYAQAAGATFRADLQHTGVYATESAPSLTVLRWKFHTGGPVNSSPAVSAGTVYVGSSDGFLYALDQDTGSLHWKFKTESRVASSPAVSGSLVYFLSYDSNFYAVNADSGTLKWKFKTAGEHRFSAAHLHGMDPAAEVMPDPFDFYLSSPAVSNGSVYFGSGDGNVYSLDAQTGALKWKFHTVNVVHAAPAISDGVVFIGSWDSYFYALDAATGKEKWKFKTGEDSDTHNQQGIQSSAAVGDGIVYFGCRDSNFYAVDAGNGKLRWSFSNKGSWVIGSPAVQTGVVYFATSDSGLLYGMDAKTGAPKFSVDFKKWPAFSSPAVAGDRLFVGSHNGKLFAIDLKTGKVSASFETDGFKENSARYTNVDGTPNYEAAFSDSFYDGTIIGVYKMLSVGAILSSPAISHQTIFFGSSDGNIYALN